MKYLEPIQRGLRPWQAALQKISEIVIWLQQNRLIAGHGVTLVETGNGIIVNAAATGDASGANQALQTSNIIARIIKQTGSGYTADLYGSGLDGEPTERGVYIFLPEAAYGAEIAVGTVLLVNTVYTKKYDVNAERV